MLALSLALNLVGYAVVVQLRLPLYLDMVGTAVASFALGPWAGAAVGLTTNAAGTALDGPTALPFGLVNAVGGIVWGYGIRRVSDIPGFLKLNLITALCCSLTAIPILLGMFHGRTGHLVDHVASKLSVFGDAPGVVASNLLVSAMDRPLSGFLALAVVCSLSRRHAVPHLGTLLNPGDSRLSVGPAPGGPPAR